MKILFLFFILFFNVFYSQNVNFKKIEQIVYENNRLGQQVKSQDILLNILGQDTLNSEESAKFHILLAETYRSINDYETAIDYLKKSEEIIKNIPQNDSLYSNVKLKMAYVLFDNNKYDQSAKYIQILENKNFKNIEPSDKAYLFMQKGYINFLKRDYNSANYNYEIANKILKKFSPCNQPAVMVKQMQLLGVENNFLNVEKKYSDIIKIADSCHILKYKIYATEEICKIYKNNQQEDRFFLYSTKLDSLNELDKRESKLLTLHDKNKEHIQNVANESKNDLLYSVLIFIASSLILLSVVVFLYKQSSKYKNQKIISEEELRKIKEELKIYSKSQFVQQDNENAILNSDKLNRRQKEILKLVAKGLTNKEIGEKLFVTEATVKFHLSNIYSILDVKNRKDILVILSQSNLYQKD